MRSSGCWRSGTGGFPPRSTSRPQTRSATSTTSPARPAPPGCAWPSRTRLDSGDRTASCPTGRRGDGSSPHPHVIFLEAAAVFEGAFTDKIALVTGAARGVGRASARTFARGGADVVVHYHRSQAMAEEVAGTVRGLGRRAVVVGANLEAPEEIARLFDEVGAMFGALDIFVANHAATAFKSTLEVKPHNLQRTFDLILRSLVLCVQRAVPLMRGGEGAIVTIGGQGTVECLPNYALS